MLVEPNTPTLLEIGTYSIRLRGTDLYLTAYEKGDTAVFARPDTDHPGSQIWYIYRSSQKNPYYSFCCMEDSSFMSIQGKQVSSGASRPHRLVFAIGTNYAYWYTSTNNINSYVGVDSETGTINMAGSKEFCGYPFEVLPSAIPSGIGEIESDIQKPGASATIYNLNGQRVATMQHGHVYIVGGKKVLYK